MVNKHEAMVKYLKGYVPYYLTFNSIIEEQGQISIQPVYADDVVKEYTNGEKIKEYTFAVVQIRQYDTGISEPSINAAELFDVGQFMEWIDEQNKNKNFPNFGEQCNIQRIYNLQNMPNLAGANDQNEAKYMFQCRVVYLEK